MALYSHKYKQLSIQERAKIELLCEQGATVSVIAKTINRSKSTVSIELRRGRYKGRYHAAIAASRAYKAQLLNRRPQKAGNAELMGFIESCLKQKLSPMIIVRMWHGEPITHTTIYSIIRTIRPEWRKYLRHRKYRRHKGKDKAIIPNRTDISVRPDIINSRERVGDWEADTVISCIGSKSCLAVFTDRKTRYYKIVKMPDKTAESMCYATKKALLDMPVLSITYDNGTENVLHERINEFFESESYFCRVYRSGDKGTVERQNRELRWDYKKGTNFDLISEEELSRVENRINERPMKCLGWLSPKQAFQNELSFGFNL